MSQFRIGSVWGGAGFILGMSVVLIKFGLFLDVFPRVIWMFSSIAIGGYLGWRAWLATWHLASTIKNDRSSVSWRAFVKPTFFILMLFVAVGFIFDWSVGSWLRSFSIFSFLSPGNLLAGGTIGFFSLVMAGFIITGVILQRRGASSSSSRMPRFTRRPKAKGQEASAPLLQHEKTEDLLRRLQGDA